VWTAVGALLARRAVSRGIVGARGKTPGNRAFESQVLNKLVKAPPKAGD
jgi:hypothetical protein